MSQISSISSHGEEDSDSGETDHSGSSHSRCSSSNSIPTTALRKEQNREASTSLESAWTDSKHSSYLNFMEANFVKNMFGSSYCSEDVCGKTSDHHHHHYADNDECDEDSAQSRLHNPSETMEFKMGDCGNWTWRPASRPMAPAGIPWVLFTNPWVKHFRPKNSSTMPSTLLSSRKDEVRSMVSKVTGSAEPLQRVSTHEDASSSNPGNVNSKTTVVGRSNDGLEAGQTYQWIQKPLLDQTVDAGVSNTKKRALCSTYKQVTVTRSKKDNEVKNGGQIGTNDQDGPFPPNVLLLGSASEKLGELVEES